MEILKVKEEEILNISPKFREFCKTDKRVSQMLLDMINKGSLYCLDWADIVNIIKLNKQFKFIEATPKDIHLFKEQILEFKNAIILLKGGSSMTLDGNEIFLFENIISKLENDIRQANCDDESKEEIINTQIILMR